jgi:hypothetical protein
MQVLGNLDMAMSNHGGRELWLNMVEADGSHAANKWRHSDASTMWVISRSMRMSHFLVNPEHFSRSPDIARIVLLYQHLVKNVVSYSLLIFQVV